jgi:hypothetical protein
MTPFAITYTNDFFENMMTTLYQGQDFHVVDSMGAEAGFAVWLI